jgi:hypothetical protein
MKILWVEYNSCHTRKVVTEDWVHDYENLELAEKTTAQVYWSPNDNETPESTMAVHGHILHMTSLVRQKVGGKGIAGYYPAQILLIRGKWPILHHPPSL